MAPLMLYFVTWNASRVQAGPAGPWNLVVRRGLFTR